MTITQGDPAVVTPGPAIAVVPTTAPIDAGSVATTGPGRPELASRIVVLLFGLIQIVIGARIVLLLLDAREANAIVAAILNVSQLFVAPFEGILRTDSLHSAGSVLDLAAIVALVGWTIVELIVLWAIRIFRRERA